MTGSRRTLAVALHDIEPATFERCALIRDWLDDHGVDRVTLVIYARGRVGLLALNRCPRGGDLRAAGKRGAGHLTPAARPVALSA
jgi:hypothetical protein